MPSWKELGKNIAIVLVIVLGVEAWQSRGLTRGDLPEPLRHGSLPAIAGGTRSLWNPEKVTVVYVFAPWCGVCRVSGRNIERLPDGFHKASLALSWESEKEVADFVQDSGLKVPVLLGQDREAEALQIGAFPSYLVLDTQGRIIKAWSGYTSTPGLWLRAYWARLWSARG